MTEQTAATFDVFLSHSSQDDAAVELLARKLRDAAGLRPWFDRWQLVPGRPWQEAIEQALDASRTCAIVIGAGGIGPWENEELRSALTTRVAQPEFRVIPVLLPGATVPEDGTLPRLLSRLTWVDFRGPRGLDDAEAFHRLVSGIRGMSPGEAEAVEALRGTGRTRQSPRGDPVRLSPREVRNRRDLLGKVKGEIAARLTQSLHHMTLMTLASEERSRDVMRPWDVEIKLGLQPDVRLRSDTEIIDIFDDQTVAGNLLILGAPGAGKSTTLLLLARDLVDRAESDPGEPMPIVLSLSSWRSDGRPLATWLASELYLKYGVRRDIGRQWLAERRLLPLLDALDELESAQQEPCVRAINQFRHDEQPPHLVVCCRLAEYQNYATKLNLNGAVRLLPLTEEQIQHYLHALGHAELWDSICRSPEMLDLATSPLLLCVMVVSSAEGAATERPLLSSGQGGPGALFDVYIERMLGRAPAVQRYGRTETVRWLTCLARQLRGQSQSEFLMERLQPSWIDSRAARLIYRAGVLLCVAASFVLLQRVVLPWVPRPEGGLTSRVGETIFAQYRHAMGGAVAAIDWPLALGVALALAAGAVVARREAIQPIETMRWSWAKARTGLAAGWRWWSVTGLNGGLYLGLIAGLIGSAAWSLSLALTDALPKNLVIWGKSGHLTGALLGGVAVAAALWRASSMLGRGPTLRAWRGIMSPDALVAGSIFGLAAGFGFSRIGDVWGRIFIGSLLGLGVGIFAGLTRDLTGRSRFGVVDALIVAIVSWVAFGWTTWMFAANWYRAERDAHWVIRLVDWLQLWLFAWIGLGATIGIVVGSLAELRDTVVCESPPPRPSQQWQVWLALRWRRWLAMVVVAVVGSSGVVGALTAVGAVRGVAAFSSVMGLGLVGFLGVSIIGPLTGAALGVCIVAVLGTLLGALSSGLTGPDVERRSVPNEGIRRSAINAGAFAAVGGLALGGIWALINVGGGMFITGMAPRFTDWWDIGLTNMVVLAWVSALVPGAACIQQFVLRAVLWWRGVVPWRYARFLDYATERMFLQRIGGRYRFIHSLLRDHFAALDSKTP